MAAYEHFCQDDHGPLFSFWSSYLSMVKLFPALTRATKDADRLLHLECVRQMLPWMYANDRTNYARYLTMYWCEMSRLEETHPAAYEELCRGEFVVQQNEGNGFAQVASDQAIEQSFNRHTKTKSGIVGFSLNQMQYSDG